MSEDNKYIQDKKAEIADMDNGNKSEDLTDEETEQLAEVLDRLEQEYKYSFYKLSGAFCNADVFDYDSEWIDVEVQYGVQNDVEDRVYTEQLRIQRGGTWEVHGG